MVKLTWSQCWNYVQGVDWVREVHRHTSITKAGTNWVVFRSVQVQEVQVQVQVQEQEV